jgi:hypothetical protein
MNDQQVAALGIYVHNWGARQSYGWHGRTAQDIATELTRDAAFLDLRLAGWLESPDGSLIAQIVVRSLPFPARIGAQVLAEAIQIAAQQRTDRNRTITLLAGIGAALAVYVLLSNQ